MIHQLLPHLGHDWKLLGKELGLTKTDIDQIEVANPHVLRDQIYSLFDCWKMREGQLATAQRLTKAAQSIRLQIPAQASNEREREERANSPPTPSVLYVDYLKGKYISDLPTAQRWEAVPVPKHLSLSLVLIDSAAAAAREDEEARDSLAMCDVIHGTFGAKRKKRKEPFDIQKVEELSAQSRVIIVEGAPGIGKSCFAWKLGVLWKDNKLLGSYSVVLLLRLRDCSCSRAKSIKDLIFHPDSNTMMTACNWISRNDGKNCLLILDGYDELPQGAQTNSIFSKIVEGSCLSQAHVVVTSRSSAMDNLLDLCKVLDFRHIEILGFAESQVEDYVCHAFKSPKEKSDFEDYLKYHPHIQGLMYIPLNAAIVVHVYLACRNKGTYIPTTMTELYTALILSLVYRDCRRRLGDNAKMESIDSISQLPQSCLATVRWMAELAYRGCLEDNLVFHDIRESQETLGLMERIPELHYLGVARSFSYNFLHKTLQEYLAGYHISLLPSSEQVKALENMTNKPHMKMVCRFLTGLTSFLENSWFSYVRGLAGYPTLLSYAKDFHTREESCLIEMLHWLYEIHQSNLIKVILGNRSTSKEITFKNTLSPFDCYVLGYCIVNSAMSWSLAFNRCGIGSKGVEMLLMCKENGRSALSWVRRLKFWENPIHDRGAECVGEAMRNNDCTTELEISTAGITSAALGKLCVCLGGNNTLTSLDISHNSLKDADIHDLRQLLVKNRSLTKLNVSLCGIGPAGLKELCSALKGNTTLTSLQLSGNTFDFQSVETLGLAIKGNRSLSELWLTKCCLDDKCMQHLSQSIMECLLKVLNICSNPFSMDGAFAVSELMKAHRSIEEIWAWSADLPHDGVCCLLDAVKANARIKKLLVNYSWSHLVDLEQFESLKSRVVFN